MICFFVILKIYNSACRTCECFDQTIFYWNNIFFNNRNLPVFRFRGVFSVNSIILLHPIFKKVFYNVVSWSDDWENCVMGCLRGLRYEQSIIYSTSIFSICTLMCNCRKQLDVFLIKISEVFKYVILRDWNFEFYNIFCYFYAEFSPKRKPCLVKSCLFVLHWKI